MATKSSLISTVNGYATAIITQAKVRSFLLELINVLFQTTITQTLVVGSNVFYYNLKYKKQGNVVHVDGYIANLYSVAKSNVDLVTIPDSLVFAKTGNPTYYCGVTTNTGINVPIGIVADKITLIGGTGSLSAGQEIKINITYQCND